MSSSRGLRNDECAQLVPYYDRSRSVAIADSSDIVETFDMQRSAARRQISEAIERVAGLRVQARIPGRRFRKIRVSCLLENQTTDRIALPAWVLVYRYRGSPYRAIVHGQRREIVVGSSPIDRRKVALVALAAAAVIAAIAAIVAIAV